MAVAAILLFRKYNFYLTGNSTMVMQLRKILKQQGYSHNQIKGQGFWYNNLAAFKAS